VRLPNKARRVASLSVSADIVAAYASPLLTETAETRRTRRFWVAAFSLRASRLCGWLDWHQGCGLAALRCIAGFQLKGRWARRQRGGFESRVMGSVGDEQHDGAH
jgi:hypothetical protein